MEETGGKGLFNGRIRATTSSKSLSWRGLAIEENVLEPSEMPEGISDRYFLALWCSPGSGEHAIGRGGFCRFLKPAGVLTFVAPGEIPAARTANRNRLICCSLDAAYVRGLEDEADYRPRTPAQSRTGFTDPSISRLIELLSLEARTGGEAGVLYADQLAHALGTRILMLGGDRSPERSPRYSAVSKPAMRRALDRIHSLEGELALPTLAKESGYSRRHFLRMFQQSVGMPPHRYVMEVRLQRAQEMMRDTSRPLIDIALACGFASHSHMSRVFRAQRGVSPGAMRRGFAAASLD